MRLHMRTMLHHQDLHTRGPIHRHDHLTLQVPHIKPVHMVTIGPPALLGEGQVGTMKKKTNPHNPPSHTTQNLGTWQVPLQSLW